MNRVAVKFIPWVAIEDQKKNASRPGQFRNNHKQVRNEKSIIGSDLQVYDNGTNTWDKTQENTSEAG